MKILLQNLHHNILYLWFYKQTTKSIRLCGKKIRIGKEKKNFDKCILVRYCQIQDRHTAGRKILKFFFYFFLLRKRKLQIEKRTEKGIRIKNNVDENTNIRSCVIQMDNGNDFYSIE